MQQAVFAMSVQERHACLQLSDHRWRRSFAFAGRIGVEDRLAAFAAGGG